MRKGISTMLLGAALFTGLLCIGGCKQNDGERCQIDDDCATGLVCVLSSTTREAGGYCRGTNTPTTQPDLLTKPNDLATPPDLVTVDMAGMD